MDGKLEAKHEAIKDAEKKLKHAKKACKNSGGSKLEVGSLISTIFIGLFKRHVLGLVLP